MRNATDLTVILDRSGSMHNCKDAMEEVINGFVVRQKQLPAECRFTLVTFDDVCEVPPGFDGVPIKDVGHIVLEPRGGTALLDTLGKTVDAIGARLSAMTESDRPNKVLVVVVTDGMENVSVNPKYINRDPRQGPKSALVSAMIKHQRECYQWEFIFLGANQDAIATACSLGMDAATALNYAPNAGSVRGMGSRLSRMSAGYTMSCNAAAGGQGMRALNAVGGQDVTEADTKEWNDTMNGKGEQTPPKPASRRLAEQIS